MSPRHSGGKHRLSAVVSIRARLLVVAMAMLPTAALVAAIPASAGTASAAWSAVAAPSPPKIEPCDKPMSSYKVPNLFIVWACGHTQSSLASDLAAAANIARASWPEMTKFMGGAPLPDIGGVAGGGDKRIDLYLLYPGQKVVREDKTWSLGSADGEAILENPGGPTSSGYLLLPRDTVEISPAKFKSVFVHEFFHLLQARYHVPSCSGGKFWFTEASAVWAESKFANATAPTEVYPRFKAFASFYTGESLNSAANDGHDYAAFIWPYFMQQHRNADTIANAWKAAGGLKSRGLTSCAALDAVVNAQLPFQKYFGVFAVENFDAELPNLGSGELQWPEDFKSRYQDKPMDPRFPEQLPKEGSSPTTMNVTRPAPVKVANLATQYDDWTTDNGLSLEFNFSGITNRQNLDITAIAAENSSFSIDTKPFKVIPVGGNQLRICAAADNNQGIRVHLILANHSMGPGGSAGGHYTVTPRAVCAASLSGNFNFTYTNTYPPDPSANYSETGSIGNVHFVPANGQPDVGWSLDHTKGSYTYTYSGSISGSSSGSLQGAVLSIGAYDKSYQNPPSFNGFMYLGGKWVGWSDGCPIVRPIQGSFSTGKYTSNFQSIDFTCSDSSTINDPSVEQISVNGTFTAVDPMLCGIWTGPTCDVTAAR
jgi:hypothetical protein